ncbi:MAG: hypothetical protein CMF96_09130 [Candidatus Marinimicrobia bacterium]|nr:hypothetical protein [Candidatus Neomarinimicrobiota bacterium]|tara:strand:- start:1638 stop:2171 length:534 start_codon:yes stop_codon:yes gene_type:complete
MKNLTIILIFIFKITLIFGVNSELPNIKLKDLNKKKVNMTSLPDNGPIAINFWNLACEPCKKEMKFLNKFHNKYKEKKFQVFSVNMDTPRSMSKVKSYIKSAGFDFTVLSDARSESFRKLGGKAMPLLLLVNKDGSIFKRHTGYNPGDEISLEKEIKELIVHNFPETKFKLEKIENK